MDPKELMLKDGTRAILRPLESEDQEDLFKFFSKMPTSDLLIYQDDVKEHKTIENWLANPMQKKVFQLGALKDSDIIAKGNFHKEGSYWQHAEIKLVVDPDYRGRGLGSQMFNAFLAHGLNLNLERIVVRFTPDNKGFTGMLDHFKLKPEAVLHSYVTCKETGEQKDLLIASYNLGDWKERFKLYGIDARNLW